MLSTILNLVGNEFLLLTLKIFSGKKNQFSVAGFCFFHGVTKIKVQNKGQPPFDAKFT